MRAPLPRSTSSPESGSEGGSAPRPMAPDAAQSDHRSGLVAIVGRPNAGKSTLLNRLLGQKVAIVSPKPQTTRNRITAIRTLPGAQVVYLDTPGLHGGHGMLGEFMAATAAQALDGMDAIVLVADVPREPGGVDPEILAALAAARAPTLVALNKIDLLTDKRRLLPVLEAYRRQRPWHALVPIAARAGTGVEALERAILGLLPPGPPLYPADTLTDQPETFFVAERIREQLFLLTHREVPYACAVRVEELVDRPGAGRLYVRATIFVEQPSQKAIVIGAGGSLLKRIGQGARRELEAFFGVPLYLALRVEVRPAWRRDVRALRELGYRLTS